MLMRTARQEKQARVPRTQIEEKVPDGNLAHQEQSQGGVLTTEIGQIG